jgi:hypothetical protein
VQARRQRRLNALPAPIATERAATPRAVLTMRATPISCMLAGVAALVLATPVAGNPALAHPRAPAADTLATRRADFGAVSASSDVRHIAHWIAHSRDNGGAEFFIVDKKAARLYVFNAKARLRASSPVLLGAARGDHSVPGIGTRPMNQVRPEERTTPAGRFVSEQGRNLQGEDVTWVDYDSAVSMHRVRTGKPAEQRLARLATPTVADNRISYGCINVPVAFYEAQVRPVPGTRTPALIYILPEAGSAQQLFGSYPVPGYSGDLAGQ